VRRRPDDPLAPQALEGALAAQARLLIDRGADAARRGEVLRLLALAQNYPTLTGERPVFKGRVGLLAPLEDELERQTGYREPYLTEETTQTLDPAPKTLNPEPKTAGASGP